MTQTVTLRGGPLDGKVVICDSTQISLWLPDGKKRTNKYKRMNEREFIFAVGMYDQESPLPKR